MSQDARLAQRDQQPELPESKHRCSSHVYTQRGLPCFGMNAHQSPLNPSQKFLAPPIQLPKHSRNQIAGKNRNMSIQINFSVYFMETFHRSALLRELISFRKKCQNSMCWLWLRLIKQKFMKSETHAPTISEKPMSIQLQKLPQKVRMAVKQSHV